MNSVSDQQSYAPRIIKIDPYGNVIWDRTLASNSRQYHEFKSIVDNDNNILIVGSSLINQSGKGGSDIFLITLSNQGNIIYTTNYGTYDNDER